MSSGSTEITVPAITTPAWYLVASAEAVKSPVELAVRRANISGSTWGSSHFFGVVRKMEGS